jgi:hypothetical protein
MITAGRRLRAEPIEQHTPPGPVSACYGFGRSKFAGRPGMFTAACKGA